jgi:catechol 2,3-dioxygenase-like lactoylglutathione lyase family enzyme
MHVGPVIAVTELARARAFYEGTLGLVGRETPGGWVVEADSGTLIYLLPGISDAGSASWPVGSFRVHDVHATVRRFRAAGVPFLGPDDLPFALDADGVSSDTAGLQVAWLKDPDGNILTVFQTD